MPAWRATSDFEILRALYTLWLQLECSLRKADFIGTVAQGENFSAYQYRIINQAQVWGFLLGGGGLRPLQHTFKEPNSKNARSFNSTQSFINSKRKAILKVVYHISESSLKYYTTFWLSSILRDKLKSSHWKSGTKFLFSGNVAKFPVTIG